MNLQQTTYLKSYTDFYNPKFCDEKSVVSKNSKYYFVDVPQKWNLYLWENQYQNLHLMYKSLKVREICGYILKKKNININLFLYHKYHGGLKLSTKTLSFYAPKLSKLFKSFRSLKRNVRPLKGQKNFSTVHKLLWQTLAKNKIFRKLSKGKERKDLLRTKSAQELFKCKVSNKDLCTLSQALRTISVSPSLSLNFWHESLPKTYLIENATSAFSRFKNNIHFWSGLQTLKLVVLGRGSAQLLAQYVCNGVRRNRKRVAFIMYIKRLIDWHFHGVEDLKIQGIRIETKGRFNAKSRCRKYILSVGRVAKGEKTSKVDYAFTKAITVFGSLGIKVWVCPLG